MPFGAWANVQASVMWRTQREHTNATVRAFTEGTQTRLAWDQPFRYSALPMAR